MSHIMVWRGSAQEDGLVGFWHHGILCPDGTVIHYSGMTGAKTLHNARILRTSMSHFAVDARHRVHTVVHDAPVYAPEEVVRRAESRLGSGGYHLVWENCESFARWCVGELAVSWQSRGALVGAAAGITSLVLGGGMLGGVLTAVVMHKFWDRRGNRSVMRDVLEAGSESDEDSMR